MKKLFLLLTTALCLNHARAQTEKEFGKLRWLVGEWNRTNISAGRTGVEKWVANSDKELQGWGITMKGSDTTLVENIKLVVKDGAIFYAADVPQNKGTVFFKVTQITENEFTCENPKHDFPKQIRYIKQGNQLKATISGNGKAIEYLFERKS